MLMGQIGALIPRVLPQVLPCPRSMVMDALQYIAGDFFANTGVWSIALQETTIKGNRQIQLNPPEGVIVSRVKEICLDGNYIDVSEYRATTRDVLLGFTPQRNSVAVVQCAVRTSRSADCLPEEILEEWGDTIAYGALAKIKAMSGAQIEWTDAQGASLALQLYNEGCARARAKMIRFKHGESLFVGEI